MRSRNEVVDVRVGAQADGFLQCCWPVRSPSSGSQEGEPPRIRENGSGKGRIVYSRKPAGSHPGCATAALLWPANMGGKGEQQGKQAGRSEVNRGSRQRITASLLSVDCYLADLTQIPDPDPNQNKTMARTVLINPTYMVEASNNIRPA